MYYTGVTSAVWQRRTHKIFAAAIVIIGITMITANVQDMKSMATGSVFVLLALGWLIWLIIKEKKEEPQPQPEISRGSGNPRAPILFLIGGYNLRLSFQGPSVADPNDKPPTYDQIVKLNSSFLPEDYISPHCEKPPRYEDLILDMSWGAVSLPPELYDSSDLAFVHSYKAQEAISNNNSTGFLDKFDSSEHHASTSYLLQDEFPPPSYEFTMNLHTTDEVASSDNDDSLNPFFLGNQSASKRKTMLSVVPEEDDKILESEDILLEDSNILIRDIEPSSEEEMLQAEFTSLSLRHCLHNKSPEHSQQRSNNEMESPYQRSTFIEPPKNSLSMLQLPMELPASLDSCTYGSANIKLPTAESNSLDIPKISTANPFDNGNDPNSVTLSRHNESYKTDNEFSSVTIESDQLENSGLPRPPSTRPKILSPKKENNICALQPPPASRTRTKKTENCSTPSTSVHNCPSSSLEVDSKIPHQHSLSSDILLDVPCSSPQQHQVNRHTTLPTESTAMLHLQQRSRGNTRSNPNSNDSQLLDSLSTISQHSESCSSLLPLSFQETTPTESSLASSFSMDKC